MRRYIRVFADLCSSFVIMVVPFYYSSACFSDGDIIPDGIILRSFCTMLCSPTSRMAVITIFRCFAKVAYDYDVSNKAWCLGVAELRMQITDLLIICAFGQLDSISMLTVCTFSYVSQMMFVSSLE
jgi:hypothetical protein